MKLNIVFMVVTLSSLFAGMKFGFTDSHTSPLPFVISGVLLFIGTIFLRTPLKINTDVQFTLFLQF